ncbi:MAG TPA: 50S ribosomal protein L21 [Bryobacteraceae bacterium]|jgi:large subunit ribosomal protein L21|nr:50S ribosomal protein L21 [Bryobacteraceae bacterium]
MYAVIEAGGKQYRVAPGDRLRVETIDAEVGATVEIGGLLLASTDSGQLLTARDLADARVVATVSGHGRGDKTVVFKFKRKKQYKRTIGHRQNYTELTVNDVVL